MNNADLCYLSGERALAMYRDGSLSPVDVVTAQIERTQQVNARLNAFTDTYFDDALILATRAQAVYRQPNVVPRPLEGLTLAIKDSHDVAGWRTTHASLAYQNNIATSTHPACQRLIDAGAIPLAKTSTPEFCSAGVTYSKLFGTTGTPWDMQFTAGGSSGGSAAALAAGMVTLATGSDIAGSIRVPAACCGVVGYKPPYGRIPASSPINLDPYCTSGPLARTVVDCALMARCMAGHHPLDITSLRDIAVIPEGVTDITGVRVALTRDLGITRVCDDVAIGLSRVADALENLGARVEWIDVDFGAHCNAAGADYLDHRFGYSLTQEWLAHGDMLCDYNVYYASKAEAADTTKYARSYEVAADMYAQVSPVLEQFDVLICPTVAIHTVSATAKPWERILIDGEEVDTDFGWVLSLPFNMMNQLPVLNVPCGLANNGLPGGVQVVARSYDDHRAFRIGLALEQAIPMFDCLERRPNMP